MNFKDLQNMQNNLIKNFNDVPLGLYINGSKKNIGDAGDVLFLAYYKTITDYLIKKDLLDDVYRDVVDFELLEKDSNPMEDDYL